MRFTPLVFLLVFGLYSSAAVDSLKVSTKFKPEHQVFVNTTFFLKQIISLSNQNIAISPYILGYKCFFTKHHGLRLSVGGNLSKKTENLDSVSTRISENNSVNYRLGYEFRYQFGKSWVLQTGLDAVGQQNFNSVKGNSVTDILTTKTSSNSYGAGPFLGIQFNINKHISLFTEVAFYYSYTWSKTNTNSRNFPVQNANRVNLTEYKGEFILPTSLYFAFIF